MKKYIFILLLPLNFLFLNAQCVNPSASKDLDVGNVRARIMNGGDFWWDGIQSAKYEIPKIDPASGATSISALFTGGIWLSGKDNAGNLKVAAMTYRNQGFDFYPGPMEYATGTLLDPNCTYFDRIWEVFASDIQQHIDNSSVYSSIPLNLIHTDILNWPAKGNNHITQVNIVDDLAPFEDVNNNNIYDPENGDYPKIKGDQALFWVVNDIGGPHNRSGGAQLGVEVQFLAYAFSNNTFLNDATMYDCKVIKKSPNTLSDFYFSLFVDNDLGDATDDYIGCDTVRNMGFAYNANAIDAQYGSAPIIAIPFLNQELSSFTYILNIVGPQSDPDYAVEFRNYQEGRWKDGSPFSLGGSGVGNITNYVLSGNPSEIAEWSMCSENYPADDFRFIQTTYQATLNGANTFEISWAVLADFPQNYTGCPDINTGIGQYVDQLHTMHDDSLQYGNKYIADSSNAIIGIKESISLNNKVVLSPNPVNNILNIQHENLNFISAKIIDLNGKEILGDITENSFDLSNLSNGLYFIELQFKEGVATKKFVKK